MSKTKGVLYGLGIVAIALSGLYVSYRKDMRQDSSIVSQTLAPEDKAKYIVDEKRHTVETVTRAVGQDAGRDVIAKTFLAPNAAITVHKDGTVSVSQRVWGTELAPFVGTSFDSEFHFRGTLGVDWFYWQRFELGSGLSIRTSDLDLRVFVGVGYNVYDNILLTAAIDNHKAVSVGVALKF